MRLMLNPNIEDQDGFYTLLLEAHDGLDIDESSKLDARLILILANHIGDAAVLAEALRLAQESTDNNRRLEP